MFKASTAGLVAALAWLYAVPAQAQDNSLARSLAATCANCHGSNGAARGEMKVLAGVPAAATLAKMAAFKSGALPATVMHQIAKGYSDEQVALLAGYFAAQKAPVVK